MQKALARNGLEQKLGKIASIAVLTSSLVFSGGCGSVSVAPERLYALNCGWCGRTIASGYYNECVNGNVYRSSGPARVFGSSQAFLVGNVKQDSFNNIINKDLSSQGGIYYNERVYCSPKCANDSR